MLIMRMGMGQAKPRRPVNPSKVRRLLNIPFVVIFAISAVGVMALWIPLLIWLAIRAVF
jgi:hypothetical protein